MMGWRARLGFLVPPGNPTVEPEMMQMAPSGVSVHFTRMFAQGATGSHAGLEERSRMQIAHLEDDVRLLALVKPNAIVMAHAAMSYAMGKAAEAELVARLEKSTGIPFLTAFGSVVKALEDLGVKRVALGTPYDRQSTEKGKALLEAHGLEVVSHAVLENVGNIYDETPERAYRLARQVDVRQAQAVFLSGLGMPTIDVLERLEQDLGKPALSGASAIMWNALRVAGVGEPIPGYGRLLRRERVPGPIG